MKELALKKFILENKDWEQLLKEPPYCLTIKRDNGLILFRYNQLDSDFSLPEVQEARGIIFKEENWSVVRLSFLKFFNYGEPNAHTINWSTARVQDKIDGSLISITPINENDWLISTNGVIDASTLIVESVTKGKSIDEVESFKDIFLRIANNKGLKLENLDRNYCYTFELVGPKNKIVIDYPEDIYHTGTRDLNTLEEVNLDIGIQKPKEYPLFNVEDCIDAANQLKEDKEGYVVVDANWNRIKIKSPLYVAAHHVMGKGNPSVKSLLRLWLAGEEDEILAYFPENKKLFIKLENIINIIREEIMEEVIETNFELEDSFEFYESVKYKKYYGFLMQSRKDPNLTSSEWLFGYQRIDQNGKTHKFGRWVGLLPEIKMLWKEIK